jgi:rubrerythrin
MEIKEIIENAIKEEEYFYLFYKDMAALTIDPEIKKKLLDLSELERIHKEKLESLTNLSVNLDKIREIEVADMNLLKPVNHFKDLKEMIQFAIKQELFAKVLYKALAEAAEDEESKKVLLMLSEEEAKHEQILTEQLEAI